MSRHPDTRTLIRELRRRGWRAVRTRGSHQTWRSPEGRTLVLTVHHLSRPAGSEVLAAFRRAMREEDEQR